MDEGLRTQILRMKREGKTYAEIVESLSISKSSVSKALAGNTREHQRKRKERSAAALLPDMAKNDYIAGKESALPSDSQHRTQYRTAKPEMAEYFNRIREANIQKNAHLKIFERISSDDELLSFVKSLLWIMIMGIVFYLIFKKRENVEIFESVTQTIPDTIEGLPSLARLDLAGMARAGMAGMARA